jgi:hypothetical protein
LRIENLGFEKKSAKHLSGLKERTKYCQGIREIISNIVLLGYTYIHWAKKRLRKVFSITVGIIFTNV